MRFLALLVFLLFILYALTARWYFVCEVRQICGTEGAEDTRLKTLKLTQEDSVILDGYDQFAFDSASISPRLNDNNHAFLDTVAAFLEAYPAQNMTITAFYRDSESEIAPGFFENIGLARADQVRKLLMKRGIRQERASLDYGLSEDRQLREPLLFELYDPQAIPDDFEKVVFTFRNMTFSDANFAYNSDEFKPGEPFQMYADSVKTYMSLNPEASMHIVGHTDSIGSAAYNLDLGLRRAQSAKAYLENLGIEGPITVESQGEARPVAPNSMPDGSDNPEGRQKNRRVNFIITTKEGPQNDEAASGQRVLEDASDLN